MAYGLKIYDEEGTVLFNASDYAGRLIHSEIVAADANGSTTLTGIFAPPGIEGAPDILDYAEEVDIWNNGNVYAPEDPFPGIYWHGWTQWTCDMVSGTNDYYTWWEDYLDDEYGHFWGGIYHRWYINIAGVCADETIVSGTTVTTVSGGNATRWHTLYTNSVSGTHPYLGGINNLEEIGDLCELEGADMTDYWSAFAAYDNYTPPYSEEDGWNMTVYLDDMYDVIIAEGGATPPTGSEDDLFAFAKATDPDGWMHLVELSTVGYNLVITYTAQDKLAVDEYMYSCDSIIYVVGYK